MLLAGAVSLALSACTAKEAAIYEMPETMQTAASGAVLQNERFSLHWDDSSKCVYLEDAQSDKIWSTTPYPFYLSGEESYSLSSPVVIEYYDPSDNSLQIAKALDCIDEGLVEAQVKDNELLVTFYFQEAEITVTIAYSLRADSLRIRLNTDMLAESGLTKLINVSVAPYLCSAENTEEDTTYLFVPSGSGALMYTGEPADGMTREFSGEVYGYDAARTLLDTPGDEEPVRLPVFGVKSGGDALCAIVENGSGAARIDALAGDSRTGYSAVYATFNVRGYNPIEWDLGNSNGTEIANDVYMLKERWPASTEFVVGYYPLTGEEAGYNGMAGCYRRYLQNNGLLQKSSLTQNAYHVSLAGGALVKKFAFGIPYNALLPLTTFEQAQAILQELTQKTGRAPEALLKGFGHSGMDAGKLAGGLTFPSALGGQKGQAALEDFCGGAGISLFTDFDILRFTQSGKGFSTFFDVSQTANGQSAYRYPLKRNVRADDTSKSRIFYLRRAKIPQAAQAVADFCKDRVSGIGLSSFGQTAYSDYREDAYMLKGRLFEQAAEVLDTVGGDARPVLLSAANAYAAGLADSLIDTPLQNGGYHALDESVPFYAMVYKGTVPLYTAPLNLSINAEDQLLRAVEAGVSPAFLLSHATGSALSDNSGGFYYGIVYEGQADTVAEMVKKTAAFFEGTAGAGIVSHTRLAQGVTRTVFSNGAAVTVNHTDQAVSTGGREIPAKAFYYEAGGKEGLS